MSAIRLPRSSSRRDPGFLQLVRAVYPRRTLGCFEGKFFRPGQTIDESALWPDETFPATPLLIENAGVIRPHRLSIPSLYLHVLWRFNKMLGEFEELLRVTSEGVDHIPTLRDAARRELTREPGAGVPAAALAHKVLMQLDNQLELLSNEERIAALGALYEGFTARYVSAGVMEHAPVEHKKASVI